MLFMQGMRQRDNPSLIGKGVIGVHSSAIIPSSKGHRVRLSRAEILVGPLRTGLRTLISQGYCKLCWVTVPPIVCGSICRHGVPVQ